MLKLLDRQCLTPTVFTCLPVRAGRVSASVLAPAAVVAVAPNTFSSIKGSAVPTVLNPSSGAAGDRLSVLYQGGDVSLGDGATPPVNVYTFDDWTDLNQVVTFVHDGTRWIRQ